MDSTLAVQQVGDTILKLYLFCISILGVKYTCILKYIQQTIRKDVSNVEEILTAPEGQDEGVWKYEHLRLDSFNFQWLYCIYFMARKAFPETGKRVLLSNTLVSFFKKLNIKIMETFHIMHNFWVHGDVYTYILG